MDRCHRCDRPMTCERVYPENPSLCYGSGGRECCIHATDWRARALDAEDAVRTALKVMHRNSVAESIARRALVAGLAEATRLRSALSAAESNATDYYWQDDDGVTWVSSATDHDARGKCSGIPACCVAHYAAGGREHHGWGYVPCPGCFLLCNRVEVKDCDESCTCGQWATRLLVDDAPELDEQAIRADAVRSCEVCGAAEPGGSLPPGGDYFMCPACNRADAARAERERIVALLLDHAVRHTWSLDGDSARIAVDIIKDNGDHAKGGR